MGGDDPLDEALTQINNKKKQTNLKRKLSVAKTPRIYLLFILLIHLNLISILNNDNRYLHKYA